jgi:hypothetical protein
MPTWGAAVMVIGTVALFFSTFATIEHYVEDSTGIAPIWIVIDPRSCRGATPGSSRP